jgi:aminoglycoside phosphotransferase (APT) family kinase protein
VTWDDHVAEIRELIGRVSGLTSSVAGSARALLEQQSRLAAAHPAQPAVPAHGTFRPAQVVLDGPRIGFIDFDGFCLAEPAMDVALFRASLRDAGLRALEAGDRVGADGAGREEGLTLLDAACERFLAVYEQAAPISRRRVALWETGEALIAVLHCWTKVKFDRLSYRLALLQRRLAEVGE